MELLHLPVRGDGEHGVRLVTEAVRRLTGVLVEQHVRLPEEQSACDMAGVRRVPTGVTKKRYCR